MDDANDRGMQRLIEGGDAGVRPIYGQQVLDEVVGPDADELDLAGQEVGGEGSARDLEGQSRGKVVPEGLALSPQLGLGFIQELERQAKIGGTRGEGKHHPQRAVGARPEQGAYLDAKGLGKPAQEPQCPLPEGRVGARGSARRHLV
jgi:hypothetical protein